MSEEQSAPKPASLEEEFERRYREEKELREAQEEERQYQIFKLQKDFQLDPEQYQVWQGQYPMGISLIWIQEKPFIYRSLLLSEYESIIEQQDASVTKNQERMAAKAVVWPQLGDFRAMEAGISATLADAIIRKSGFGADFEPIAI